MWEFGNTKTNNPDHGLFDVELHGFRRPLRQRQILSLPRVLPPSHLPALFASGQVRFLCLFKKTVFASYMAENL